MSLVLWQGCIIKRLLPKAGRKPPPFMDQIRCWGFSSSKLTLVNICWLLFVLFWHGNSNQFCFRWVQMKSVDKAAYVLWDSLIGWPAPRWNGTSLPLTTQPLTQPPKTNTDPLSKISFTDVVFNLIFPSDDVSLIEYDNRRSSTGPRLHSSLLQAQRSSYWLKKRSGQCKSKC